MTGTSIGQGGARGRVTMTDVAREAGCSQTTVSIVLSGAPDISISPATRRRVIEAVAALGYRLRPSAKKTPRRSHRDDIVASLARPGGGGDTARQRSRTARVIHRIGLRIIGGRYVEGAILPGDAELMEELGVSRTVLREALRTLSGKGLIEAKSRVGTRVRARSAWQLFDPDVLIWHAEIGFEPAFLAALGEMRLVVEPEAAALAAQRRNEAQIERLHMWVDRMAAGGARHDFVDADLNFHLEIARIAGNPFLPALSALIEVALVAALTRSSPVDEAEGVAISAAEHRAIVEAIARSDAQAARLAMRQVIEEGIRRAT